MQSYEWQAYDVCQVNYGDGVWMDFATIRDALDARYAVANVDHPDLANGRYGWGHDVKATFRITRGADDRVVYFGPS